VVAPACVSAGCPGLGRLPAVRSGTRRPPPPTPFGSGAGSGGSGRPHPSPTSDRPPRRSAKKGRNARWDRQPRHQCSASEPTRLGLAWLTCRAGLPRPRGVVDRRAGGAGAEQEQQQPADRLVNRPPALAASGCVAIAWHCLWGDPCVVVAAMGRIPVPLYPLLLRALFIIYSIFVYMYLCMYVYIIYSISKVVCRIWVVILPWWCRENLSVFSRRRKAERRLGCLPLALHCILGSGTVTVHGRGSPEGE